MSCTQACTCTYVCGSVCVCVCSSAAHMNAAESDSSVSCWPSGARHGWDREQREQRRLPREREEKVWTTSVLTLHFSLIHHLKQKGHWLWDECRAEQRAVTRACMQTTPWHANTADMQQHSADCQAAQLDAGLFFWPEPCLEMERVQLCNVLGGTTVNINLVSSPTPLHILYTYFYIWGFAYQSISRCWC